jgi:hypothetical protein
MKSAFLAGAAILACAASIGAQTPCSLKRAVVDSARSDLLTVLGSGSPLVAELRQEQNLKADDIQPVTVNDRTVCARLASTFNRVIPPGVEFAVLRVGQLYYARDPDQKRSTGVLTDSTFKVVMRLGAEVPAPPARKRP